MARRSERTTGLPRARRRDRSASSRAGGIPLNDRAIHIAVISAATSLLAIVLVLMGNTYYQDRWGHGREVILRVGEEEFTLGYFADRLFDFATQNQGRGFVSYETALMNQLEREGLAVVLAGERGIVLDEAAVDRQVARDLGVPEGADPSALDSALRNALRTTRMSFSTYERRAEARAAEAALLDLFRGEVGARGEVVSLRVVVLNDEADAQSVVDRIRAGENMGTIAQTESIDLVSRTEDGLRPVEPPELLEEEIAAAIAGKSQGDLVGPVPVGGTEYWVIRVESRGEGDYTDAHRAELAGIRLDDALAAQRETTPVRRTADVGDFAWALEKAGS